MFWFCFLPELTFLGGDAAIWFTRSLKELLPVASGALWDECVAFESLDESRGDAAFDVTCEEVVLFGVLLIDYSDAYDAVVLGEPDAYGTAVQDLLNVVPVAQGVAVALGIVPEVDAVRAAVGNDLSEICNEVIPLVCFGESIREDVCVSD